ncbi:MAG: phosphodiesterase [Gammaproteobacteria bacterium]|nr:MAG: phosphodiesterase [Gammaproteobacteria bacterium]
MSNITLLRVGSFWGYNRANNTISIEYIVSNTLRLLHVTDLHLGNNKGDCLSSIDCDESLNQVIEQLKNERYDALLITGDIANHGAKSAYLRLQVYLSEIKMPVYMLPGNHDDKALMQQVFGELNNKIELGAWNLIFLDSNDGKHYHGQLSVNELDFLEGALKQSEGRHTLIALHHPPVDIGSAWMDAMQLKNKQAFFDIIDCFESPRAVVWGHIHQEFDQYRRGVRLLSSPSTCSQFLPQSAQHQKDTQAAGYRWLELNADGSLDTGVIRVTG